MTHAQQRLSLIENVDPADTAGIDEIDKRTQAFLHGLDQEGTGADQFGELRVWEMYSEDEYKPYTRSRDALGTIWPKGWLFGTTIGSMDYNKFYCVGFKHEQWNTKVSGAELGTKELAELHAILQAIEYERGER